MAVAHIINKNHPILVARISHIKMYNQLNTAQCTMLYIRNVKKCSPSFFFFGGTNIEIVPSIIKPGMMKTQVNNTVSNDSNVISTSIIFFACHVISYNYTVNNIISTN